ncbi:hypothetical protein LXA43DRAFT_887569 [Ganoderma leucocontextum]|nr:hypothetical protein LXA43DRAFT_887569 [Ganoderma leucocontextum]
MTPSPSPEGNTCSHAPKIGIPDVRVILDNYGSPNSSSIPSLEDASFHTLLIPENPNPDARAGREVSIALLHHETTLALRSENIVTTSTLTSCTSRYHISDAGEAGLGVFATVAFERGERIIHERPLIVYPQLLPFHSGRPVGQQYPELGRAIERMPQENRDAFFDLMNAQAGEPSLVKGIIDTNALFVGPLPRAPYHYAAVCKDISRINHSCSPNAAYHFDVHTFAFDVRALFPISAGEQIFISYIDPALPRTARQDALSSYAFTCACSACSLTGPALTQSETRRALIARADAAHNARDAALAPWARTPPESMPDSDDYTSISTVDKMYMDLFEKEGLYYEPVWEGYAARLCKAACVLEDGEGARRWAELAAALSRAYTGSDRGWDEVAAAPERTDWWGVRARQGKHEFVPGVGSMLSTATISDLEAP